MSKIRLFVGIPPDPKTINVLETFQESATVPVAHTRWAPAENQHLTLFFIGSIPTDKLNGVKQICAGAPSLDPFELPFDQYRLVLRKKKPSMIWAQYHLQPAFEKLARYLEEKFKPFQKRESRHAELTPHCTLARIRSGAEKSEFHWEDVGEPTPWIANQFCLYQSTLNPRGAKYSILEAYPFTGHR